jgi:hypothetical protein
MQLDSLELRLGKSADPANANDRYWDQAAKNNVANSSNGWLKILA